MNWKDLVSKMLTEGKAVEEIISKAFELYPDVVEAELLTHIGIQEKAIAALTAFNAKKTEDQAATAIKANIESLVKAQVDLVLKDIKVDPIMGRQSVQVSEHPESWRLDMVKSMIYQGSNRLSVDEASDFDSVRTRIKNRNVAVTKDLSSSLNVTTSNQGNDLIPVEFDMEIDKLVYTQSEFLDAIKIRKGTESTDINGIGTFDFTARTTDSRSFTETAPSTAKVNIDYRDAGAIVAVTNRMMNGSAYNVVSELLELAADAKIRYLEPILACGRVTGSGDPFNGIWFSGINTKTAKNNAPGSGLIEFADLTNIFLGTAAQTRRSPSACFVMGTDELQNLMDRVDKNGQPIEIIKEVGGKFYFKGRRIIACDLLPGVNGVTDKSTAPHVPVFYGALDRFRVYQNGSLDVKSSGEAGFEEDATKFRFKFEFKVGLPSHSLTSFTALLGVKRKDL